MIPVGFAVRSFVAKLPRVAITRGWIRSIFVSSHGRQTSISSGWGSRLPGGRQQQDVVDEDVVAAEADALEQLAEELARAADERQPGAVLLGAGRLADEHQVGVRVAGAEHDLGAGLRERAARAGRGLAVDLDQALAALRGLSQAGPSPSASPLRAACGSGPSRRRGRSLACPPCGASGSSVSLPAGSARSCPSSGARGPSPRTSGHATVAFVEPDVGADQLLEAVPAFTAGVLVERHGWIVLRPAGAPIIRARPRLVSSADPERTSSSLTASFTEAVWYLRCGNWNGT